MPILACHVKDLSVSISLQARCVIEVSQNPYILIVQIPSSLLLPHPFKKSRCQNPPTVTHKTYIIFFVRGNTPISYHLSYHHWIDHSINLNHAQVHAVTHYLTISLAKLKTFMDYP